jgi:multiple sugar transport system substrate-binding protein
MNPPLSRRAFLGVAGTAAAAGALSLAGCSSGGSGDAAKTVRMTWWGGDARNSAYLKSIDLFKKANAGVTITPQYGGYDGYFDKFNTEVAGGKPADLVQMDTALFNGYVEKGVLLPLDQYLSPSSLPLYKPLIAAGSVDGKFYGVSSGTGAALATYDLTVLRQIKIDPPADTWTWDDMAAKAKEIAKAMGSGKYGINDSGGDDENFVVFLRQRKKDLYTADGKLGFISADLEEWWTYWDEMRKSGACVPAKISTEARADDSALPILAGLAPLTLGTGLEVKLPPLTKNELHFAPAPTGPGGTEGNYLSAGVLLVVTKTSKAPAVAAKLAGWFATDPGTIKTMGITRGIPPSDLAVKELTPTLDAAQKRAVDCTALVAQRIEKAGLGNRVAAPAAGGQIKELMVRMNDEVGYGRLKVADAAKQFFEEGEKALAG